MGLFRLTDFSLRRWIRMHWENGRSFCFSRSGIHVLIRIWSDPMEADADGSHSGSSAIIRIIHPSHTLVLLLKVLCCISHT